jgi:uncharacterized protein YdhG (YjbR/CyaY superfamily)
VNQAKSHGERDVDVYLASQPGDQRGALQTLRACIKALAPHAQEGISYGLPGFKMDGRPLVSYGGFKNHCSLFPGSASIRTHARDLQRFDVARGTIRFTPEKPLPPSLVRKLVRARLAELRKTAK